MFSELVVLSGFKIFAHHFGYKFPEGGRPKKF